MVSAVLTRAKRYHREELIQRARDLVYDVSSKFLELAEVLHSLKKFDHRMREAADDIGLGYRKVMYLAAIHEHLVIPRLASRLNLIRIGWSKLGYIAAAVSKRRALPPDWVSWAVNSSITEIQAWSTNSNRGVTFSVVLTLSEKKEAEHALLAYGAHKHSRKYENRAGAFMAIIRIAKQLRRVVRR